MIIVNIQGGLGNQLFQYAFGYTNAKILKTFFLVDNSRPFILSKYFKVSRWHSLYINENKYIQKLLRKTIRIIKTRCYIDFTDCNLSKDELCIVNKAYYDGYFQSIGFFEQMQEQIQRKFRIRSKYINTFQNQYGLEFKQNKTLVIHIRRTDYSIQGIGKNLGNDDVSLPISYYKKCLSQIDYLANYKIIFVGDDMEFAKANFSYLHNVSFEQNELIVDFQLLMNADIAIISNSTFAWWAAFLNPKVNKHVFAPKYFLGFHINKEFPVGISYKLPYEWINVY